MKFELLKYNVESDAMMYVWLIVSMPRPVALMLLKLRWIIESELTWMLLIVTFEKLAVLSVRDIGW